MGMRRGDDFDPVAILQFGAQRHQILIDTRRDTAVADVGVHGIGEIHRCCTPRHRQDATLGREHIDLVREQVDFDMLQELAGITTGVLNVEQRLQPLVGALLYFVQFRITGFVQPVRGHAGLGDAMHLLGADLRLDRCAIGADQRGV